jgi:DNA-binding FadR family transcriptional regulator
MRQVIEPAAAYDAARHGDPAGLAAIAEAYAKMSALAQDAPTDAKVAADLAFHVAVAGASGNRFFQSITGSILHALRRSFEALIDPPGNYEANLANHRAVRDAIRAGQAEAAEAAMTKLLRQSANATARLRGREPGQHGRATG